MSKHKKKRHTTEWMVLVSVLILLCGGVFYLKTQQDDGQAQKTGSESDASAPSETTVTPTADASAPSEATVTPTTEAANPSEAAAAPTAVPAPEETLSGEYQAVDWARVIGDRILVCQTDAIEVRDFSNHIVKDHTDLGRLSRNDAVVYSNGSAAYYASSSESGSKSIWRLDLETGEKEEILPLDERDRFAGASQEYLYYTVWSDDGLENTLKAYRLSDGSELEIGKNLDEVTVLSDHVITMGLRFDVSPVELKVWSPDGSSSVTVGKYVNSYQEANGRIYYLEFGSDYGYLPADLKSCSLSGQEVQVLAEDLNALSFQIAGEHMIYYASAGEGTDTSTDGYLFYDYQTGESKKAADSGTYLQFLCSDGAKAYLAKEDEILVFVMASGQFLDAGYQVPDGWYSVEGFLLDGTFWSVQQSSDNRVEVFPVEDF